MNCRPERAVALLVEPPEAIVLRVATWLSRLLPALPVEAPDCPETKLMLAVPRW